MLHNSGAEFLSRPSPGRVRTLKINLLSPGKLSFQSDNFPAPGQALSGTGQCRSQSDYHAGPSSHRYSQVSLLKMLRVFAIVLFVSSSNLERNYYAISDLPGTYQDLQEDYDNLPELEDSGSLRERRSSFYRFLLKI